MQKPNRHTSLHHGDIDEKTFSSCLLEKQKILSKSHRTFFQENGDSLSRLRLRMRDQGQAGLPSLDEGLLQLGKEASILTHFMNLEFT